MHKGQDSFLYIYIYIRTYTQPANTTAHRSYRSGAAPSIESDFLPGDDEDPDGREGGHVFEVLPHVFGRSPQQLGLAALPVVDLPADAVVHVCPERRDEGPAVRQRKRFWRELADQRVEGDDAVVVDLHKEIPARLSELKAAGLSENVG